MIYSMKKNGTVVLRILAIALVMLWVSTVSAQVTKKADKQFAKGRYSQALYQYTKVLKNSKLNVATKSEIYCKMAKCYMAMDYYKPARQCFEKVMVLNPEYINNFPIYTEILRCNGRYLEALSYYYKYNSDVDDTATFSKQYSALSYPIVNNYCNPFVSVFGQYAVNTFGKKRGLQFYDGKLYYSTTGYMLDPTSSDYDELTALYNVFKSDVKNNVITNSQPESGVLPLSDDNVLAFAVQPGTNTLYFVAESRGRKRLYYSQYKDSSYSKISGVKIGKERLPVESLTFTSDGAKMFFSADMAGGVGGKDLWYSELSNGEWQKPVNMGTEINTSGDEITPFVFNNTLFFSSNGQVENYGGFDIYSVFVGDTSVGKVCNLKMPYNSCADDFSLVVNPDKSGGFFVSNRDTSILDDKIYGFAQLPDFTMYRGFITDKAGRFLDNVNITLADSATGKTVHIFKSGKKGEFGFFLENSKSYRIEFEKDNYFPLGIGFHGGQHDEIALENITMEMAKVILDGFELNKAYKIEGVFHQTADVEVCNTAILSSVTTFLKDNPHLNLYVHLFGYISSEEDFNEVLNQKRLENLTAFLKEHGVASNRVRYESYENLLPVDFPVSDISVDNTYLLYFVISPKNGTTVFPKTEKYRRR